MATRSGFSWAAGGGMSLLLLVAVVVSATMGFMQIPAATVLQLIGHALSFSGKDAGFDPVVTAVVMDVRLHRNCYSVSTTWRTLGLEGYLQVTVWTECPLEAGRVSGAW